MKKLAIFGLLSVALSLAAQDKPTAQPEPAKQIPAIALLQYLRLQDQAEILRLKVCSDAGIKETECMVNWQLGTVGRIPSAPPALPRPEAKQAK